uniref:Major facilitator superfamily (MFS) profile domain-containing protein n=1 Tax=Pyrodinium bahamense TaxID=73915 RepID=A0A7S0A7R8_9DINO|mmetsp:Transcript_24987/g.68646  ORF Transcript_24987/g.68646 Transcript_24987/m.68646 type:complete len:443 (+) Transcript_24987:59-1387(+)
MRWQVNQVRLMRREQARYSEPPCPPQRPPRPDAYDLGSGSSGASGGSEPVPWRIVLSGATLASLLSLLLDFSATTMMIPLLPYVGRALGASVFEIDLTILTTMVAMVPGSMLMGFLGDKYAYKASLVASLFLNGVSLLIANAAADYWQLFLARTLTGVFASSHVISMALLTKLTPKRCHTEVLGIGSVAQACGFLLGPPVAETASAISYPLPFFIGAGIMWFNAAFATCFIPSARHAEEAGGADGAIPPVTIASTLATVASKPSLALVCAAGFIESLCFAGIVEVAPVFFNDVFDMPFSDASFICSTRGAFICGFVCMGPMARRLGSRGTIITACACQAFGSVALLCVSLKAMAWGFLIVSLSVDICVTAGLCSIAAEMVPPAYHGSAFGCLFAFKSSGFVIGSLGSSLLYSLDLNLPFAILAACQVVAIFVVVAIPRSNEA